MIRWSDTEFWLFAQLHLKTYSVMAILFYLASLLNTFGNVEILYLHVTNQNSGGFFQMSCFCSEIPFKLSLQHDSR